MKVLWFKQKIYEKGGHVQIVGHLTQCRPVEDDTDNIYKVKWLSWYNKMKFLYHAQHISSLNYAYCIKAGKEGACKNLYEIETVYYHPFTAN